MENLILASLPTAERSRLEPFLEPVAIPDGAVLIQSGAPIERVWFLDEAIGVTAHCGLDGTRIPFVLSGHDGLVGFELWLRNTRSPLSTIAAVGGRARTMRAADFTREVVRTRSPLNDLLADYVFGFIAMASQLSACNRNHSLEERLCRWLRMIGRRLPARTTFRFQAGLLAELLATERSTASITARVLHNAGLIRYEEPEIQILDEQGLEDGACECYPVFDAFLERARQRVA